MAWFPFAFGPKGPSSRGGARSNRTEIVNGIGYDGFGDDDPEKIYAIEIELAMAVGGDGNEIDGRDGNWARPESTLTHHMKNVSILTYQYPKAGHR